MGRLARRSSSLSLSLGPGRGPGAASPDTTTVARRPRGLLRARKPPSCRRLPSSPAPPTPTCSLTFREDCAHLQVAGGESDDGRFVQLRGDGRRQREQLGQLVKLAIFLLPPGFGRIFGLLLHRASALGILDLAALQARGVPPGLRQPRWGRGRQGSGESGGAGLGQVRGTGLGHPTASARAPALSPSQTSCAVPLSA